MAPETVKPGLTSSSAANSTFKSGQVPGYPWP